MDAKQLELQQAWGETSYECKAILTKGGVAWGILARSLDGRNIISDLETRRFAECLDEPINEWNLLPLCDNCTLMALSFPDFCKRCDDLASRAVERTTASYTS